MLTTFYQNLLLPAFESVIKRRSTFRYWSHLQKSEWLKTGEIESQQFFALQQLLANASLFCEYYRRRWAELGLCPEEVNSMVDFQKWPIIDRETIRKNRSDMQTRRAGTKLISKSTGGSSGVPLKFDLDTGSNDRRTAAAHRGYSWANAAPGNKQVYLWGVALVTQSRHGRWKDYIYNRWLYRRHILNCFELSEKTVPAFYRRYNRIRPENLVAYTNPLYTFARCLDEQGLKPIPPKSIVVGAERLHDFQRQLIERVFQAPVFETYGSREFMLIGAECDKHEGLHLTMEHLLIEILDDQGNPAPDGQEGDVVITDLYNYGMPFIRYRIGDRAVAGFSQCSCGRGLPLLRKVVGRNLDILTTPDGRKIPGEFFPHLLKDVGSVRQFQVVQDRKGEITIKLVVDSRWSQAAHDKLEAEVRMTIGDQVGLVICVVDEIPLTNAGKHQVVVNLCGGA